MKKIIAAYVFSQPHGFNRKTGEISMLQSAKEVKHVAR